MPKMLTRRGLGQMGSLLGLRYGAVALGVVASVVWARYVPKEVYGQYQMIMALLTLVSGFCLMGVEESMTIAAAKRYDGNVLRLLGMKVSAGLLGALAVAGTAFYWRGDMPGLFVPTVTAACLFVPWAATASSFSWLNGRGLTKRLFVFQFILAVVQVCALGLALWAGVSTTAALLACIVAPQAVLAVILIAAIVRGRENRVRDSASVRYGWHVSAANALLPLLASDKLLLGRSLGPEEVAVYAVALLFPQQITTLYSVVNQMLVPDMYKASSVSEAWTVIKPRLPLIIGAFCLIGVVGFVLFPLVIPALFSEKYVVAVPYGKWLWISLAIAAPATYLANILRAQQKLSFVYSFNILQPMAQFALYIALIDRGVMGMTIARIAMHWGTSLFFICFFFVCLQRERR